MFNDPNREAVGLVPIWTGADTAPEPTTEVIVTAEVIVTPLEDDAEDQ